MAAADMSHSEARAAAGDTLLLPVLPLDDVCLLPGASLSLVLDRPAALAAVQLATRTGDRRAAGARGGVSAAHPPGRPAARRRAPRARRSAVPFDRHDRRRARAAGAHPARG